MNCKNHPDREAVGKCSECGVGLCAECYDYFESHICYECAQKVLAQDKKFQKKTLTRFIVFGIIGLVIGIALGIATTANTNGRVVLIILAAIWGFLAGSSYGMALMANKGVRMIWWQYLVMLLFSIILAPIYFVIRLVRQIKLNKIVKSEIKSIQEYPYKR